jgi:lipopolysaccharide/colanic/teichoic acid biosynthesis glycosyltransferase
MEPRVDWRGSPERRGDDYRMSVAAGAVRTPGAATTSRYERVKRGFDVVGALLGLGACLPLLGVTWIAVRVFLGSPVIFCQVRPGRGARPFTMYKFRSMIEAADSCGSPLADDQRLTLLGRAIRATSIDELPALWNVVRGDMSLVGPRPLLMEYLSLYTPEQARRHEVLPGLTGWAQIHGRNRISWEEKLHLDVWYVDNRSLLLDLRIIVRTAWLVLRGVGVTAPGSVSAHRFRGSANE